MNCAVAGTIVYVALENLVRKTIAHYRELQEIIALLGIEELSATDRTAVKRARHLMRFLTQPFMVTVAFTGKPGRTVELGATLAGCRAILDGEADEWAEGSLYLVGGDAPRNIQRIWFHPARSC